MNIVEVKNLTKRFGDFTAVDDISFSVEEGEILGLLGPNGAGKTTTIQMLLGVLTPSAGKILFFNKDLLVHREKILEDVSFSSTYTHLPDKLTVRENLKCISYLYDIPHRKERLQKIIKDFRLEEFLKQETQSLSAGQITRVNLAKAFLNSPKVLLLDEPTASLDPDVAQYMRSFLLKEKRRYKVSMIFTSHNMSEVEEVCDRVIFINHGKIIADDTPEKLARSVDICHIELLIRNNLDKVKLYCQKQKFPFRMQGRYIIIDLKEDRIAEFLQKIVTLDALYEEISIEKPTLEDYFLHMTKKKKL